MSAWTNDELMRISEAEEVAIAPSKHDGTLGNRVTIWLVRAGEALYVRSAVRGHDARWYRAVEETHRGRISAGGLEKEVNFADVKSDLYDEVDAAYRSKYRRYAGRILNSCLTPEARSTTLQLTPARQTSQH